MEIEEENEGQRRLAQLSRMESSNLRELLSVREDGGGGESVTLARVLATEKRELSSSPSINATPVSSRTLLDVIKDEDDPRRLIPGGGIRGVSWKAFKNRLRIRRTTDVWSSDPGDDVMVAPGSPRPLSIIHPSELLAPSFSPPTERPPYTPEGTEAEGGASTEVHMPEQLEGPTRVSLMALLEQQERSGPSFAASVMGLVKDEEDEEEEDASDFAREVARDDSKDMFVCCVCMVRHKGAAFIPCGHTFCRLCSRELWASRGNCPLCNGYIREILDIF